MQDCLKANRNADIRVIRLRVVVLALAACACADSGAGLPTLEMGKVEFTGPAGSSAPNLFATRDGSVLFSWFEEKELGAHVLRTAVRSGTGWSRPVNVVEDREFFVNWADFPSVMELSDGQWVVHWLEEVTGGTYSYHIKLATSSDRGESWSSAMTPHRDQSPTEHGFVSMLPLPSGGAALVWLDGRNMSVTPRGDMSVRSTTVESDGSLGDDELIDDRTCECCQTALALTSTGLLAAYRDRGPQEIRDIVVVRYVDGSWTAPVRVYEDGWYYPGCPVNGPALASAGDTVVIAWYTAPEQKPRVQVAFSTDGGAHFNDPIRTDEGSPLGRVDVEFLGNGVAVVTWLEGTDTAEVLARVVRSDGATSNPVLVTPTSAARSSGFPRLARAGAELVFAWTDDSDDGGVRVATGTITW